MQNCDSCGELCHCHQEKFVCKLCLTPVTLTNLCSGCLTEIDYFCAVCGSIDRCFSCLKEIDPDQSLCLGCHVLWKDILV